MLEVKNLSAFYGNIEALRAADLRARTGKITTIIGANGAGKTTLLRAISGLIPTRYGEIRYFGKDIANSEPHAIVKMGISHVPEGRQVFGSMSVEENLQLGAYTRSRRGDKAKEIQKDLDFAYSVFPVLSERRAQYAGTLSGGEQQMLAIGRGLMSSPRLLLLDEPSMGLAPLVIKDIFTCLRRLHEEGLTILLVEQDAQIALSVSDVGYVMRAGKVRLEGDARELLQSDEIQRIYLGEDRITEGEGHGI
ncbi:MAG: branched-chain amino acid ABC transporter ATP-binding protein [Candidatus Solincola sediminis]|uniref:Branched-chain amino acid ABC transporter ATP-binding protein n=1 Tax=Candidatus Solincola sediminis TaxID=1797199 RepID=A0A1F2WGJ5_9ACTN|nr:MAG: branched-chain amino acid ABC transporter ATP-binding protein [Candidatus Solincola sediminis]